MKLLWDIKLRKKLVVLRLVQGSTELGQVVPLKTITET